jgi:hypothetical protein
MSPVRVRSDWASLWVPTNFLNPNSELEFCLSKQYQVNELASTYVRLVEAAIVEYNMGVAKLQEFWGIQATVNLSALHRSGSHFETCLPNIYRATISCKLSNLITVKRRYFCTYGPVRRAGGNLCIYCNRC